MSQRILLVDDREDNLFSMETILTKDGYEFVKASSGRQALKILLKEFDFALILMDVKMPILNGFETAALIYEREKLKHIPIIFITANTYGEENVFKGYQTGAVDYIYKPINPDLLRAKVAVFVDLYKKKQQLVLQEKKLNLINQSLQGEILERKASEEKISQLNQQLLKTIDGLEKANKELDRFAFMASHDLQEPLRKIGTFSDRLYVKYKDKLDADGLFNINRIQKSAARMQALIGDILTFSKVSVQKEEFVQCNLGELLQEVVIELQDDIDAKGAQLEIGLMPSLHVIPGLMKPLFFNLLSNALKYSKPGVPAHVQVYAVEKCEAGDEPAAMATGQYCRIFFKDNGIGFDQQYAAQVFEMFQRLHAQSEYEGTGIGLALCKQIVEKHNGFISVLSKINEGSTFIVSLPVK
ncbi:MAG: hybrid sensor histidine kinase/response regulator [Chitinophagaceae bacterium]|nr:MAG: hybrid sensor histidine kinase/response regulator [Chitinophagaceae bacterium]